MSNNPSNTCVSTRKIKKSALALSLLGIAVFFFYEAYGYVLDERVKREEIGVYLFMSGGVICLALLVCVLADVRCYGSDSVNTSTKSEVCSPMLTEEKDQSSSYGGINSSLATFLHQVGLEHELRQQSKSGLGSINPDDSLMLV